MTVLREHSFSHAKSGLSTVMGEVVHDHRPQLVRRRKESMLLVRPDDARRWLDTFRLTLRVVLDEEGAAVTADPVGVLGFGASLDEALDDLVVALRDHVRRFFDRPHFYRETEAGRFEPWLVRFALTHPDEHRALLESDIEAAMPKGNRVASAV